jgi:protein-S-isoprenylcysteine O-methyltransferase Ste14
MFRYKPPKELRALFIIHYAPLLLIIMIGPLTALFKVWTIPFDMIITIVLGAIIFLLGAYVYFKWEIFWNRTYQGQLVTGGIFQYIRHPHYTSLLVIGFGLSLFFYSLAALLVAIIAIPIMIWSIIDEEKLLIKQYGKEYKDYMKKVPWRIIPKIF